MTTLQDIMVYREKQAEKFKSRADERARQQVKKRMVMLEMAKLHNDDGLSYAEIGKKYNVSRQRVYQLLKEFSK
jgi:transposase